MWATGLLSRALLSQQTVATGVVPLNFLRPTLSDQVIPMLEVRRIVNKAAGEAIKLFFLMFAHPPLKTDFVFEHKAI